MAEAPSPEHRSNAAIICLGCGFALIGLSWFLGLSSALTTLTGNPAALASGALSLLMLPLAAGLGATMVMIGFGWIIVRVLLDRDHGKDRYSREVER